MSLVKKMVRRGLFKGNDRDRWTDGCNEVLQWRREPGLSAENDKEKWEFIAKEQDDGEGGSVSAWEIGVALGSDLGCGRMVKHNQNVGIVGKYGACYGAPLGKIVKKI